jgi:hypothetical protein
MQLGFAHARILRPTRFCIGLEEPLLEDVSSTTGFTVGRLLFSDGDKPCLIC